MELHDGTILDKNEQLKIINELFNSLTKHDIELTKIELLYLKKILDKQVQKIENELLHDAF